MITSRSAENHYIRKTGAFRAGLSPPDSATLQTIQETYNGKEQNECRAKAPF